MVNTSIPADAADVTAVTETVAKAVKEDAAKAAKEDADKMTSEG